MEVRWVYRNYFHASDVPAFLLVDTGGLTVRLKVYDDLGQYIDDTVTGVNRTGRFTLKVWDTNPHTLSSPKVIPLFVEIYDTSNRLIEKHVLNYVYGSPVRTVNFAYPDGSPATADWAYACHLNGVTVFATGTSSNMPLPVSNGIAEAFAYSAVRGGKFYSAFKIDTAPNAVVLLGPSDKFLVRLKLRYTPLSFVRLFGIPGFDYLDDFLSKFYAWFTLDPSLYLAHIISATLQRLGINLPIVSVFFDGDYMYVDYEQDIAWEVVVFALIAFIIALPGIVEIIHDITTMVSTYSQAERDKYIADTYRQVMEQYNNTFNKAMEYVNSIQDPNERMNAFNQIMSSPLVNPSTYYSGLTTVIKQKDEETEKLKAELNNTKNMLYLAIGVAIVIAIIIATRS
jgi:hypothetical protein